MTSRLRSTLPLLLAFLLAEPLAAQTARDTTHVTTTKAARDSVARYLRLKGTPGYAARSFAVLLKAESLLVASVAPAPVPAPVPAPTPAPTVATVTIHSNGSSVRVGHSLQLETQVQDATLANLSVPVALSLDSAQLADLSALGVLTGKAPGTVVVTATAGGVRGMRAYPITAAPASAPPQDTISTAPPTTTTGGTTAVAELPRVTYREDSMPPCATIVRVLAGTDLQAALNLATPGSCLYLPPGSVFIGNFILPNKGASSSWITLRTDVPDASLGAIGTRMTPTKAATLKLAKILGTFNASALMTAAGAHHWRLTGLDLGGAATSNDISGIVRFGTFDAQEPTVASMAHHLVIDRSYIHGTPTQAIRRCVFLSSAATQITDSWISDCHSNNGDSQAILALGGAGPYTIDNNTLSGGHEVFMAGGGDPFITNLIASDISITRNDITRPVTDLGKWGVKNLLELKSAARVLVEGNVLHNNWNDAQTGFGLLIKSVDQEGKCTGCGSTDVTVRYNVLKNSGAGVNLAGHPETSPVVTAARITLSDNLIDSLNVGPYAGPGIPLMLLAGITDALVSHNSFTRSTGNTVMLDGDPMVRLSIIGSAFVESSYGMRGSGTGTGTNAFEVFAPGYTFRDNINALARCDWYPATTQCPAAWPTPMPLASDGRAIGADLAKIAQLTAGVVIAP